MLIIGQMEWKGAIDKKPLKALSLPTANHQKPESLHY